MLRKNLLLTVLIILLSLTAANAQNRYDSYIIKFRSADAAEKFFTADVLQSSKLKKVFPELDSPVKSLKDKLQKTEIQEDAERLNLYYLLNNSQDDLVSKIAASPFVEDIFPNYIFKIEQGNVNDPDYSEQWGLKAVNAAKAWEKATGEGILVGVLDTGIDYGHEDLRNQLWINSAEDINGNGRLDPWPVSEVRDDVSGDFNGIDDDGNGYPDDVIGFDFIDQTLQNFGDASDRDADPFDEHSHGTIVSGVIAAAHNNKAGITGMAYNSKIMTLRAMDVFGYGESDDIAAAIVYGALNGADVMNFSFGELYDSPLMRDAVKFAYRLGCVMAASSGNNGADYRHYPSDYPEVISVGGSNIDDERYSRSNFGSHLDIIAPGVGILSTTLNNDYREATGTSLSAPFVASAAAMLKEKNPDYGPDEIKALLQLSARDIFQKGWDIYAGAGILDAAKALEERGNPVMKINSPGNESVFDKSGLDSVAVTGTVLIPLMQNYELLIAPGDNQKVNFLETPESENTWIPLITAKSLQIRDDTLGFIKLNQLQDTNFTLRLKVNLKNGSTLERRIFFEVFSSDTRLKITALRTAYPWFEEKRVVFINANTNYPSDFYIEFEHPEKGTVRYTEIDRVAKNNSLFFYDDKIAGKTISAEAVAYRGGDTVRQQFFIALPDEAFPEDAFIQKDYSFPRSNIDNETADIYDDGTVSFAVNDLQSGDWGRAKTYKYQDGQITVADSINDTWIPVGLGDSNGDGKTEIFAVQGGNSILFQAAEGSTDPFSDVLFEVEKGRNFWAAAMYDFTGDGLEDLVAYDDSSFVVMTYQNGEYVTAARAVNTEDRFKDFETAPGIAIGDFDGDGRTELCHSNPAGMIFIFEYDGSSFHREFLYDIPTSESFQLMSSADIDADGFPEILAANFGRHVLILNNDAGTPVWQYRILKATGKDTYKFVWTDYVYGVRSNLDFDHAAVAGDIDGIPGDEIIISPFPNLYILKWDKEKEKMTPFWHYPTAYTNSALINDFDGNGINEVGFGGIHNSDQGFTLNTSFYEYSDPAVLRAPGGFDGWALNESSVFLKWSPVSNAVLYNIYRIFEDGGQLFAEVIDSTNENSFTVGNLENKTYYRYAVTSVNRSIQAEESEFTYLIEAYTHKRLDLLPPDPVTKDQIILTYDGLLAESPPEPSLFKLYALGTDEMIIPHSAIYAGDSSLVLHFNAKMENGPYVLEAKPFPDYYRTPTKEESIEFLINFEELPERMYLRKLDVISKSALVLQYSEDIIASDAENIDNYEIAPIGEINSISMIDNSSVRIELAKEPYIGATGRNYTLTVRNVRSAEEIPITDGPGNTLAFVFSDEDPDNAYVYPNPVQLSKDEEIFFANLPERAKVHILTMKGELLRTLDEIDGNGGVEWDGRDNDGKKLATGIYLFKVERINPDGSSEISDLQKFAVTP